MNDLIPKVKALLSVLSDNVNDYSDSSLYRMVQEKSKAVQNEIDLIENKRRENLPSNCSYCNGEREWLVHKHTAVCYFCGKSEKVV